VGIGSLEVAAAPLGRRRQQRTGAGGIPACDQPGGLGNFYAAENGSLAQLLDLAARRQVETGRTEDHKEAARAFVEKRAPAFAGR
jgi:hypothetical protein